jgi:integrase/recombinase XerD
MAADLARFTGFCRRRALTRPAAVTPATLDAFAVYLRRVYRTRGSAGGHPLKRSTVTGTLRAVRAFFAALVRAGELFVDPAAELVIRGEARLILDRTVHARDFAALVRAVDASTPRGVRNRAMLEVLFGCGLRRAELVALDVDDVDVARGLVCVRHGKGGRGRLVPLQGQARRWVSRYLERARPEQVTAASGLALFLATGGRRLAGASVCGIVREAGRRAALVRPVSPHQMRHGYATGLLCGGADVRAVQVLLGHERLDTTEHYTHLQVDDLKRVHQKTHPRERRR